MTKLRTVLLAGSALVVLATTALSYAMGALPGTVGLPGTVPNDVARIAPSCGQCHMSGGPMNVQVAVDVSQRTMNFGDAVTIRTSATGGVTAPGMADWGGFVAEVTRGKMSAGLSSQIDPTGRFITHLVPFFGSRDWQFGFTAPQTAGLIQLFAAVNTVDGDGTENGDVWGLHGDPSAQNGVPVNLFVHAPGTVHHGDGCPGSFGFHAVVGAPESPTVGNSTFRLELKGAAPLSPMVLMIGSNPAINFDLTPIGVTGCRLYVQPLISIPAMTGPGTPARGDGTATLGLPIPNDPTLKNALSIECQLAILDSGNGRAIPVTMTNAVRVTVQ